jgi:hypothetical protein
MDMTSEQFTSLVADEMKSNEALVIAAGIKVE